jgi:hypothetical protein
MKLNYSVRKDERPNRAIFYVGSQSQSPRAQRLCALCDYKTCIQNPENAESQARGGLGVEALNRLFTFGKFQLKTEGKSTLPKCCTLKNHF